MTAIVVALSIAVAVLTLLVVGLLRSHAEILRRLHALDGGEDGATRSHGDQPVGRDEFQTFPEVISPPEREGFTGTRDLAGVGVGDDAITVRVVGVEHRTLIAFLSGTCITCQRFWEAFRKPTKLGLPSDVRVVVVTKDPAEESVSKIASLAPKAVPVVMSSEAWAAYDVPGSPYFVLVDGRAGRVQGEGTGIDWPQVKGLLMQVADDEAHAAELDARRVPKHGADDARERKVDAELLAAGIAPGDPSLYGDGQPSDLTVPDAPPPHARRARR